MQLIEGLGNAISVFQEAGETRAFPLDAGTIYLSSHHATQAAAIYKCELKLGGIYSNVSAWAQHADYADHRKNSVPTPLLCICSLLQAYIKRRFFGPCFVSSVKQ